MDPACRVCVNGTARFECVRCEDGSSLDPTSNQCQRKSVCFSVCFQCFICESGVTFVTFHLGKWLNT